MLCPITAQQPIKTFVDILAWEKKIMTRQEWLKTRQSCNFVYSNDVISQQPLKVRCVSARVWHCFELSGVEMKKSLSLLRLVGNLVGSPTLKDSGCTAAPGAGGYRHAIHVDSVSQ